MEEEKVILNPIQKAELERTKILDFFFPYNLAFSSDLQQLILDFLFPRLTHEIEKDHKKKCLKLHLAIKSGKLYYHLYVMEDNKAITLSSFSMEKLHCATMFLTNIRHSYVNSIFVPFWSEKIHRCNGYVFCPKDNKTYMLEIYHDNGLFYAHLLPIPERKDDKYIRTWTIKGFLIGTFSDIEVARQKLCEYIPIIEEHGDAFHLYPHDGKRYEHSAMHNSCVYCWPVDDVF